MMDLEKPADVPWVSAGKMAKSVIRTIQIPSVNGRWTWLARRPYDTWYMFGSWEEAALYLKLAHRAMYGPLNSADECECITALRERQTLIKHR